MGQFNLSIEVCISQDCNFVQGGRITFIADGSALTNALYDYEGYNDGDYGKADKPIPANDNRKWALDYIADSLVYTEAPGESADVPEVASNAMVIFDETATYSQVLRLNLTTPSISCWFTSLGKDWQCFSYS